MSAQIREVGTDGITRRVPTPASQPGDTFPAGIIQMWAGPSAPSGWLFCDGSAVARATYPTLFSNIGTTWGAGDGSTTFNLPNFHDAMPIGAGNLYALAAAGGEATHALTAAEMPVHSHTVSASGSGSGSTDAQGNHTHAAADWFLVNGTSGSVITNVHTGTGNWVVVRDINSAVTQAAGVHAHNVSVSVSVSGGTGNAGSGAAHNNLPPYKGIHFIIRAY